MTPIINCKELLEWTKIARKLQVANIRKSVRSVGISALYMLQCGQVNIIESRKRRVCPFLWRGSHSEALECSEGQIG